MYRRFIYHAKYSNAQFLSYPKFHVEIFHHVQFFAHSIFVIIKSVRFSRIFRAFSNLVLVQPGILFQLFQRISSILLSKTANVSVSCGLDNPTLRRTVWIAFGAFYGVQYRRTCGNKSHLPFREENGSNRKQLSHRLSYPVNRRTGGARR